MPDPVPKVWLAMSQVLPIFSSNPSSQSGFDSSKYENFPIHIQGIRMNSKKKTPAAQQLIDSLLDELPLVSKKKSANGVSSFSPSRSAFPRGPRELVFVPSNTSTGEVILEDGQRITIRDEDAKTPKDRKLISGDASKDHHGESQKVAGGKSPPPNASTNHNENDRQNLSNFKKNVNALSDNSVIFTGELGGAGTSTLLGQAGKANAEAKPVEDAGDPLFIKTKSNSLHIHSAKNLEDDLGPAVDLLVEAMELTNPGLKKPARVLPRAESTPRRDLKDAPQVEDVESGEELVRRDGHHSLDGHNDDSAERTIATSSAASPAKASQPSPGSPSAPVSSTSSAGPRVFESPLTQDFDLNIELESARDYEPGLPAIPDIKIFSAIPLSQNEISLPSQIMHSATLDEVSKNSHTNSERASDARFVETRVMDQHLEYGHDEIKSEPLAPIHSANAAAKIKKSDPNVADVVAALPKLGAAKVPTPKDVRENGLGVLDRVLAKVRASGFDKSIILKDALTKRSEVKSEANAQPSGPADIRTVDHSEDRQLGAGGEDHAHREENNLKDLHKLQELNNSNKLQELNNLNEFPSLDEKTLAVIESESSRAGAHSRSSDEGRDESPRTASSRLRWTENSSVHLQRQPSPAVNGTAPEASENTLLPIEPSRQGPLDTMDRLMATEIRPGAVRAREQQEEFINQGKENPRTGKAGGVAYGIPSFHSAEASLKQSESLRIAQTRISDLEHELERLRRENEKLASAGETLRRHSDELRARAENAEQERRESERIRDEERKVMRGQMSQKDRENIESRQRLEEAEGRLESNFKKIRVRERELEHRLEIMKMESATLVSTKDKMILELKRQLDQLTHENEYGKQKAQEAFSQYKGKQETIRRVVRALRIALTILEGDDENVVPRKKAE